MNRIDLVNQEVGGMDLYLREIRDHSLLSAAEETVLANAIRTGDRAARSTMIQANLRLVVKIARDYSGRGMSMEDLIGEGNLGLIRATEDYNPAFGTRFSTYASYWIKQSIRHALTNTNSTIRLPAHMVTLLSKWRKVERALTRQFGQSPSFDQVAEILELTDAQRTMVERARRASQLRLEMGDNGWSPDEANDHRDAPDAVLEADDERRQLMNRLDRLDDRERTVVSLRYGLDGSDPMTLKEVGRRLGVTREWVRKIEVRAVKKLDDEATATPAKRPNRRRSARSIAPMPSPAQARLA